MLAISKDFTWFYRVSPEKSAGGEGNPLPLKFSYWFNLSFWFVLRLLASCDKGTILSSATMDSLFAGAKINPAMLLGHEFPCMLLMSCSWRIKQNTFTRELLNFKHSKYHSKSAFFHRNLHVYVSQKYYLYEKNQHLVASLPWDLRSWLPIWKKKFSHAWAFGPPTYNGRSSGLKSRVFSW